MAKKPSKMGRPPKPPDEKHSEAIYVKLTPEQKRVIVDAIDEPSVVAREYLLRKAGYRSPRK